ncbi:hypothetical protein B0H11DRAFT_2341531 [Mycena galericulata]|nr:hypothetical protein B0H11DRAFT_2341531 [Mycena galericulata]
MSRPRGKPSPFTPEQDKHIESFFPALMYQLPADLKAWKKSTAETIVASPLFLGKLATKAQDPVKGGDSSEWKTRIEKKFQNFFNRHQNGSFYFSPLSGIALFELEHRESIAASAIDLAARTNTSRDLCYQMRRREQWDALDPEKQNDYQSRASSTPANVATNQADFTRSVGKVLTELCRGGQVGDLELMLFWAFRENNGIVQHGIINAHAADNVPDMADTTPDWDAKFGIPWKDFAEQYIPNANPPSVLEIQRNSQGLPVFPNVDWGKSTSSSLCDVIVEYLSHLWRISWKETPVAWTDIDADPEIYYDIDQFTLPVRLRAPESLGHANIFALAEYFASAKPPFVFRDGGEAVTRKAARQPASTQGDLRPGSEDRKASPGSPPPFGNEHIEVPSPEAPKPSHDNRDTTPAPPLRIPAPRRRNEDVRLLRRMSLVSERASKKIKVPANTPPARIQPKRRTVKNRGFHSSAIASTEWHRWIQLLLRDRRPRDQQGRGVTNAQTST